MQRRFVADASHELRSPLATIGAGLELLHGQRSRHRARRCAARPSGSGGWSTTCCCSPAPTSAACSPGATRSTSTSSSRPSARRPSEDGVAHRGAHRARSGASATAASSCGCCATSSTTRTGTPLRRWSSRSGATATRRPSTSPTTVPASPPTTAAGSSSGSYGSTTARARADGGSGLGLAIVAEVVAAHDGKVWVEENPGGGALFRVRLPAAELRGRGRRRAA